MIIWINMIECYVDVYWMCEYMLWSESIIIWSVVNTYWWLLRCVIQSENNCWCVYMHDCLQWCKHYCIVVVALLYDIHNMLSWKMWVTSSRLESNDLSRANMRGCSHMVCDMSMVCEFPDVFDLPSEHEVEVAIYVVFGTRPMSMAP